MNEERIRAWLTSPRAYPHPTGPVVVHETHISLVFLAGDRAYKVKRAVWKPFLDYSTLEARRAACRAEVAVNAEVEPDLYLGIVPIDGSGRIGGPGQPVEYAVEMVRLPADGMLDEQLARGPIDDAALDSIARRLVTFHDAAAPVAAEPYDARVRRSFEWLRTFAPSHWAAAWERAHAAATSEHADEFAERLTHAVDGHGDLHAGNLCIHDGRVVLFDRIEFEPEFRRGDPYADLAFLLMDLQASGAWDVARRLRDAYATARGDDVSDAVLDVYLRHRGVVRGGVTCDRGADGMPYFRYAAQVGVPPFVVMLCGLPGTGKSHVARALAHTFDAVVLRSDEIRKELYGMAPTDHWDGAYDEGPYTAEMTERTYTELAARAEAWKRRGRRVVLDATFDRAAARARFPDALCLWIVCDDEVIQDRLRQRAGDETAISDAGWDVYQLRKAAFESPNGDFLLHDGAARAEQAVDKLINNLCTGPLLRG